MNQLESGNRVRVIDVIRGFCLMGILVANMLIFQYGIYGRYEMQHFNQSWLDGAVHAGLLVAVEGSFMPIFMFLFGYGLYKLRESLLQRGLRPAKPLVRRFLMLIALGLLHSLLLWEGDILLAYGATGFCLLLFVKRKPKTLLIWGVILSVLMAGLSYSFEETTPGEAARMEQYVQQSITVYGEGTYGEIAEFRLNEDPLDLPAGVVMALTIVVMPLLLSMFLFGIAAANKQWFHNPQRERGRYARAMAVFLPLGVFMKGLAVWQSEWAWSGVLLTFGGQVLALGYIFGLAFALSSGSKESLLVKAFESVGRMSLTNYLMQTVICTTIFYGYGLGWFGKAGVLNGLFMALIIYAVQAAASSLMLRRFKNGPLERLLRMWTYFTVSGRPGMPRKRNETSGLDTSI